MIRVGFVGCGDAARRHAEVLRDFEGDLAVEFAGFYDISPIKSAALAARFGGPTFTSLEKMLDAGALDAAWICLPPRAISSAVSAVSRSGAALCLEAPLGAHIQTANALQSALGRANVPVLVSTPWRYGENFERLRKILSAKNAPPIAALNGIWSADWPHTAWRRDEKNAGIWLECAWPLLDMTRALAGTPRRVFGASGGREGRKKFADSTAPDVATLTLELADGGVGNLVVARVGREFWRLEIVRSDGVFRLENGALEIESNGKTEVFSSSGDELKRQNLAFLKCATLGKRLENKSPLMDALKSQKLALTAQRSLASARWINITP